jgi:hypothetical protein
MAQDVNLKGVSTGTAAFVGTGSDLLKVSTELDAFNFPENVGSIRTLHENDPGILTGAPVLTSSEVDEDFRVRIASDTVLDDEVFNYTAQNTGKHFYATTTTTATWTTSGLQMSSGASGACQVGTYKTYSMYGANTLSIDMEVGFINQPVSGHTIDFGLFHRGAASPYAPTDGVYFRLTSAGLQGICNINGSETSTGIFPATAGTGTWVYDNNDKNQYIVYVSSRWVEFWVCNTTSTYLLGRMATPSASGQPMSASSLPMGLRMALAGTPGTNTSVVMGRYSVRIGGALVADKLSAIGNRVVGSYEGQSGGTMGSLANYANSANPTAAVPTNTTAALGTGLGGQFWETATLALTTDGIIQSYQVPALNITGPCKRLVIRGIWLTSYIQTVIAGGPFVSQYSLAFGHTSVSLATAEAVGAKAPRRIALPFTQAVTAAQAVSTLVTQLNNTATFENPVYVNPGEFVALVVKHVGTVGTSGVIAHVVGYDYGWE